MTVRSNEAPFVAAASVHASAAAEPVGRRYAVTLASQLVQLALAVVTASIVPRGLGPTVYGTYSFLLGATATVRSFMEPSVQQAFFTFSSRRQDTGGLTKLYALWTVAQLLLVFVIIGVVGLLGISDWLWPDQGLTDVAWVTVLDWVVFVGLSLRQLGDSKGWTVVPQALTTVTAAMNLVGVLVLVALGQLTFGTYVALNIVSGIALGGMLAYWLLVRHAESCWTGELKDTVRDHLGAWWRYARPLIAIEYCIPIIAFLSMYLVQRWYGSVEQGYLALALRWSTLVLIFTSSATTIFWREIASTVGEGRLERAAETYRVFARLLFFVTVVLSWWLALNSEALVVALAGEEYREAAPVLMLMAFYPVVQTIGQLNIAVLKAAGRTSTYRKLAIVVSVPDVVLTYVLLAPATAPVPGLQLGAFGVALRMVVYGIIAVAVYEWSNSRFLRVDYRSALRDRSLTFWVVAGTAGLMLWVLGGLLRGWANVPLPAALVVTSATYFVTVACATFRWPSLVGMTRTEVRQRLRRLSGAIVNRPHAPTG